MSEKTKLALDFVLENEISKNGSHTGTALIFNVNGFLVRTCPIDLLQPELDLDGLIRGTYYIHIRHHSEKIIIE